MSTNGRQHKPILVAERVRKVYRSGADSVVALQGLDLVVPQGQFLAVMGPSGSGKTTLAYLIASQTKRRFRELSAVTAGVGAAESPPRPW